MRVRALVAGLGVALGLVALTTSTAAQPNRAPAASAASASVSTRVSIGGPSSSRLTPGRR